MNKDELKPKGIFLKMDWDELFKDLDDASVGKMIKNTYNYLNNRELIKMDKIENVLFKHTITPVLKFNVEKYNKQVAHNRSVAHLGGRPSDNNETQNIQVGLNEAQTNPSGLSTIPENPKDKEIEKEKARETEIENNKSRDKANSKNIDIQKRDDEVDKLFDEIFGESNPQLTDKP